MKTKKWTHGLDEPLNIPGEQWRDVEGYEGIYKVSDLGRVKGLARTAYRYSPRWKCDSIMRIKEKIMGRYVFKYRYKGASRIRDDRPAALLVSLSREGKASFRYVHHLVLEAFVGLRPQGTEACHWDGDATNNRLENLRWGTSSDNTADAIRLGQFWPKQRSKAS